MNVLQIYDRKGHDVGGLKTTGFSSFLNGGGTIRWRGPPPSRGPQALLETFGMRVEAGPLAAAANKNNTQTFHIWHVCRSVGVVPGGSMKAYMAYMERLGNKR